MDYIYKLLGIDIGNIICDYVVQINKRSLLTQLKRRTKLKLYYFSYVDNNGFYNADCLMCYNFYVKKKIKKKFHIKFHVVSNHHYCL